MLRFDEECQHVAFDPSGGPKLWPVGLILGPIFMFVGLKSGLERTQADCDAMLVDS